MSSEVKAKMLKGAMKLLGKGGVHATSFSEVVKATGAPRGSIYHHFPAGKDQMISEAVSGASDTMRDGLTKFSGSSPEKITKELFRFWRSNLDGTHPTTGCPIFAVIVSSETEDLRKQAGLVLKKWREDIAYLLKDGGLSKKQSLAVATILLASIQGATVISRGDASLEALDTVEEQMIAYVKGFAI